MPCDTAVIRTPLQVVFAKNSDRQGNEAQYIEVHPAVVTPPAASSASKDGSASDNGTVALQRCTYLSIPWKPSCRVILSRPSQMWGAEMGVNEHGVCVGNEALFASTVPCHEPRLTGMDLVRLALERSIDASSAACVIVSLLTEHGQGGDCGFEHPFHYHNGFVIVDAFTTLFLYTVGTSWYLHDRTSDAIATMSNTLPPDRFPLAASGSSTQAIASAVDRYGIRKTFLGWGYHRLVDVVARGCQRSCRLATLLHDAVSPSTVAATGETASAVDLPAVFGALRDHGGASLWRATRDPTALNVCMHLGPGPARHDATTSSFVVVLSSHDAPRVFATGTSSPCLSAFKNVPWFGDVSAGAQRFAPRAVAKSSFDANDLWWASERVTRDLLIRGDEEALSKYSDAMQQLEKDGICAASPIAALDVWDRHARLIQEHAVQLTRPNSIPATRQPWFLPTYLLNRWYALTSRQASSRFGMHLPRDSVDWMGLAAVLCQVVVVGASVTVVARGLGRKQRIV